MKQRFWYLMGITLSAFLVACAALKGPEPTQVAGDQDAVLSVSSPVFQEGERIPQQYSCDGENTSPPLEWDEPPAGTESLALIMDDPDAPSGTFVHWVAYNIPPGVRRLPEAVPLGAEIAGGGRQAQNSARRQGYNGPCPPSGTHRYFFRLYALDTMLDPNTVRDKGTLLAAMEGHALAQGELYGTYAR